MDVRTNIHAGQLSPGQLLQLMSIARQIDPAALQAMKQAVGQLQPEQVVTLMNTLCAIDPKEVPAMLQMVA